VAYEREQRNKRETVETAYVHNASTFLWTTKRTKKKEVTQEKKRRGNQGEEIQNSSKSFFNEGALHWQGTRDLTSTQWKGGHISGRETENGGDKARGEILDVVQQAVISRIWRKLSRRVLKKSFFFLEKGCRASKME